MNSENPLQRAHSLSAQASILLKQPNAPVSTLETALAQYTQAADLFERSSSGGPEDAQTQSTLRLLTAQHRRMAKDLERRIATAKRAEAAQAVSTGAAADMLGDQAGPSRPGVGRRVSHEQTGSEGGSRRVAGEGLAVGLGGVRVGTWPASAVSTRSATSPSLGLPPFALRQPGTQAAPPVYPSTAIPSVPPARASHNPGQILAGYDYSSLSPLVSSSSSDESFMHLGGMPDTLDPFSRFWGMLDNMLDDISNPVAFASAPMGIEPGTSIQREFEGRTETREKVYSSKGKGIDRAASPSESFYMVQKGKSERAQPTQPSAPVHQASPAKKTPEELELENEHLRASLDALAVHTQEVESRNKQLREQAEERDKTMRGVVLGVRREAQKAKQGTDIMRSQLLASISSPRSTPRPQPPIPEDPGDKPVSVESTGAQRQKIRELEEQVRTLKEENAKQKGQIDKYKTRFETLKVNARAKREAKASAAASVASATTTKDAASGSAAGLPGGSSL